MSTVFSSLPPMIDTLCSQKDLDAVRAVLEAHAGEWVTTDQIAREAGWEVTRTCERVRKAKGELLLLGIAILQSHEGYKLAESVEEIDEALNDLHERLRGLNRTIMALEEARAKRSIGQKSMAEVAW